MNKRILAALAIVIIVLAAFVAMWQLNLFSPAPSAEARNLKIGIVAGMQTVEGQDIERAAQLAIDEINAEGGIWVEEWHTNVDIELVLVDTVDDAAGSTAGPVTRGFPHQGVDFLLRA